MEWMKYLRGAILLFQTGSPGLSIISSLPHLFAEFPQLSDWADVTSSKKYFSMNCNIPSINC